MHIRTMMLANRHHKSDGANLACRQPLRRCIRAISRLFGSLHHAAARFGADFRIAVERPADGRLRNAQQLRQLFQVHVCHFLHARAREYGKAAPHFPKRFRFLPASTAFLNRKG
ncbi:hypothetical protein D3C86_1275660 [compost metagenome]